MPITARSHPHNPLQTQINPNPINWKSHPKHTLIFQDQKSTKLALQGTHSAFFKSLPHPHMQRWTVELQGSLCPPQHHHPPTRARKKKKKTWLPGSMGIHPKLEDIRPSQAQILVFGGQGTPKLVLYYRKYAIPRKLKKVTRSKYINWPVGPKRYEDINAII